MKTKNKIIGRLGEEIAVKYLETNGYVILERNYSSNIAEIDIIAMFADTLIIVEVKTRKNRLISDASKSVNILKQNKIKSLTEIFLQENNINNTNIRFDIIECYWGIKKINHIINAF